MTIHHMTAIEACKALKKRSITAQEIKTHLLSRVSLLDDEMGAFIYQDQTAALDNTELLAGLPISFKDQFHIENLPCSFGLNKTIHSDITAPIAEKLFAQGATLLGKTSLPPLAMDFQTNNPIRGFCKNPWNPDYTVGGSSGGGATAVATGMSFVDIGTDLSGSLRIPASFCGVYSLLPSEGAVSSDGMLLTPSLSLNHFARPGPIARQAKDLALMWRALSGEHESSIPKSLNLAYWLEADDVPLDADIQDLITQMMACWQQKGHQCVKAKPKNFCFKKSWETFGRIMGDETSAFMNPLTRWLSLLFGNQSRKRSPNFLNNVMKGYRRNPNEYTSALKDREETLLDCHDFFKNIDAWILPVTCCTAFKHMTPTSEHGPSRDYREPIMVNGLEVNYFDALTAFTTPVSLIGHPVVTIPIGLDRNGLPIGIQIVGRMNKESELISIAEELSKHTRIPDCPVF
ncbi:amidase [Vibrio kagoshimensis]|uniref:amidase n=1 Tax=Vibrio kagoshimensis TaxID=2910244 RepID=UPI003D2327A0